ncbi:MAG: hypothetical protein A4E65_00751 [Syntrophorhabdus sp. PtaU1.Bin153]|nr:MAG: hypothetical protein A4E65_00751 [Syntrophorhabdus sp. PtaU1.Bin153]
MNRELLLEAVVKPESRTMEDRLIEIFGCFPFSDSVIRLDGAAKRTKIESDVYPDPMEESLIEVFGCLHLSDRVIRLDGGTDRKRTPQTVVGDEVFPYLAGIA